MQYPGQPQQIPGAFPQMQNTNNHSNAQAAVPFNLLNSNMAPPQRPIASAGPRSIETSSYYMANPAPPGYYQNTSSQVNFQVMPGVSSDQQAALATVEEIKAHLRDRLTQGQPGHRAQEGYIRGAADFRHQYQQYVSLSFRPAAFAGDFPDNDDALKKLAKGLSDAMLDFDGAVEAGQKSVTRIYQLSPYEVELKSWEFLFVLRDVQLGRVGLPGWGKSWAGEDFDCFMDRYDDVVSKLHASKSIVSSMFDQDFSIRLALAPAGELKKKIANMNNNARKAVELAMVRDLKKRKRENDTKAHDSVQSEPEATGVEPPPAHATKRACIPKRPQPQNQTNGDDQMASESRRSKRAHIQNINTGAKQLEALQAPSQNFAQPSSSNHDTGILGHDELVRAGSISPAVLDTPGLIAPSEVTESTGYTGSLDLQDVYAFGHDAFTTAKLNLQEAQGFSFANDHVAGYAGWMGNLPNDAMLNDSSNELGIVGSEPNFAWSSAEFNLNPEESHAQPFDELLSIGAGFGGEAFTFEQMESYDFNADIVAVDDAQVPDAM